MERNVAGCADPMVGVASAADMRTTSLAHRLLAGSGRASVFAYGLVPTVVAESVAHGLTPGGELVVAVRGRVGDPLVNAPDWCPIGIRMDIVKEAPEWVVRITACSLHLLGQLTWLGSNEAESLLRQGGLHPRVIEVAGLPGGRLGVIAAKRVLVHDAGGVTPLDLPALRSHHAELADAGASAYPVGALEEWDAREAVMGIGEARLRGLFESDPGRGRAVVPPAGLMAHGAGLADRVLCIDVDRHGVTLMRTTTGAARLAFFDFAMPAQGSQDILLATEDLLADASIPDGKATHLA